MNPLAALLQRLLGGAQAADPYAAPAPGSGLADAQQILAQHVAANTDPIHGPSPTLARAQGMRPKGTPMGEALRGGNPNRIAAAEGLAAPTPTPTFEYQPVRDVLRDVGRGQVPTFVETSEQKKKRMGR